MTIGRPDRPARRRSGRLTRSAADLQQLDAKFQGLAQAHDVPGGGEEDQAQGFGELLEFGHLLDVELQGLAVLAVGGSEAVLARVGGLAAGAGEQGLHVALLELDGVGSGLGRLAHHVPGHGQLALVVVADLGHHEAGEAVPDAGPVRELHEPDLFHIRAS